MNVFLLGYSVPVEFKITCLKIEKKKKHPENTSLFNMSVCYTFLASLLQQMFIVDGSGLSQQNANGISNVRS